MNVAVEVTGLSSASLAQAARILVLVGGILMVVFSALGLLELVHTIAFRSFLENLNILSRGFGLITLILGVVSIIGAKYSNRLEWAIILIIIGYVGSGLGGLLVLVGGILGLVSVLVKKT
jgi:hypothetical protein